MSFTSVEIVGTVEYSPGVAIPNAVVTLQASSYMTDGTIDMLPYAVTASCNSSGQFTIASIPANDDSTTLPTGTFYTVTITKDGVVIDTFEVIIPKADAPSVNLFSLARLSNTPSPSTTFVSSFNGRNGVVTPQSGDYADYYIQVSEGPLYAEDSRLGLVGDGSTDNAGKDATIKSLLGSDGGELVFRNGGVYLSSAPWDFDSTSGIVLRAADNNIDRTQTPSAELRFTASGTTPQLTAQTSQGFTVDGLAVRYSSASFTGRFVSVIGSSSTPTYRPTFRNMVLSGASGTAINASDLIDLGNTVEATFEDVTFALAVNAVMGYDGSNTYSTAVKIRGGRFVALGTSAIANPHENWLLDGVVFENASGGAPAGIVCSSSFPALGLTLVGCGFYDASSSGDWISFYGDELAIIGGFVSLADGVTYCVLNGTVHGFKSLGNVITGPSTAAYLSTANTPAVDGFVVSDDLINGVTDNVASLTGVQPGAMVVSDRVLFNKISSSTYAMGITDLGKVHLVDASAAAVTVTLPDTQLAGAHGQSITIKKVDNSTNAVTINPVGGERVDPYTTGGGFSLSLASAGNAYTLRCDANTDVDGFSAWYSVGKV